MEDTLQEGIISFDDLMAEGNNLEVEEKKETPTGEEPAPEESAKAEETSTEEEEPDDPLGLGKVPDEEVLQAEQQQEQQQEGQEEGEEGEEPNTNTEPETPKDSLTFLSQKFIESGKWEDVVLDIEGEEVQLSELKDIDEETFLQIQEAQENLKEEANKEKFIPKEGLNEISLKLIELQKNGGDISEAFQVYNDYVNPLEGLDLSNEKVQEGLVRRSLSKKVDDPEIVEMTIAKYKKDLVLDQKAQDVVSFTNDAFDKYIEQKNTEAATQKQEETKAHKEYLKNLQEEYKSVDIKPEIKKQILELADKNEKGEYRALDVAREQLQDPKLAQELLFFLNNRDAFKKSIGSKVKSKTNIDTMKKVSLVPNKQKKQTTSTKKEEDHSGGFDFQEIGK